MQKVFTETHLEGVDLTKTQPFKYFVYIEQGNPSQELRVNYEVSNIMWHFLIAIIWHMLWFLGNAKVFALFYFEFEGNFPVQASVGLYLEGRFNGSRVFLHYEFGRLIFGILRYIIFETHGTFIDLANPTFFLVCITVFTSVISHFWCMFWFLNSHCYFFLSRIWLKMI